AKETVDRSKADAAYVAADARVRDYHQLFEKVRLALLPLLAALLVMLVMIAVTIGLPRRLRTAVPYYVGAAACVALLVLTVQTPPADRAGPTATNQVAKLDAKANQEVPLVEGALERE